jgi:hypothetical protein
MAVVGGKGLVESEGTDISTGVVKTDSYHLSAETFCREPQKRHFVRILLMTSMQVVEIEQGMPNVRAFCRMANS